MSKLLFLLAVFTLVLTGCGGAGGGIIDDDDETPRVRAQHLHGPAGIVDYYLVPTSNNDPVDITTETPDRTFINFGATTSFQNLAAGQFEVVFTQQGTKTVVAREILDLELDDDVTAILQTDGLGGAEVSFLVQ